MESFLNVIGLLAASSILIVLAFPNYLLPERKAKKKTVGSSYWGVYKGSPVDEPESMKTIELKQSARKERVVGGSRMYEGGRGTSFRQ